MILVTGASSGIGEACARAFAARGKDLVLIARRLDRLKKLSSELEQKFSVRVQSFALDLSSATAVQAWIKDHAEVIQQTQVLINNAGLAKGLATLQEGNPDDWDLMFDTNVKGLLRFTRAFLPSMIARKSGHIINLGSVAGHWVYPSGAVYCATKFAVRAITEGLRMDLHGTGVRVSEVSPGMVETEFSEVRLGDPARARAVYQGFKPLDANDIAETVVWMAERPQHVNIQEIVIYPTDQAAPTMVNRR